MPVLALVLVLPPRHWGPGALLMGLGEGVRLAAVGYIGAPSRTRGADVGPLVTDGPYGWVRNPLYLGNLLLYLGIGVVVWPAGLVAGPLLALYYSLIVRWEEANLERQLGAPYRDYLATVPRWLPRPPREAAGEGGWSASRAFRSERSTLLVLAAVLLVLFGRGALG